MGGTTSKAVSKAEVLEKLDCCEQFSIWKTALCARAGSSSEIPREGLLNEHIMTVPLKLDSNHSNILSPIVKLRFFFYEFEKCGDVDHNDIFTGVSLWMTVESDHPYYHDQSFAFSVKTNKTVNGKLDSTLLHRDVVVTEGHAKEILIDEYFLVLGIQQKNVLNDGKEEKNVALFCDKENEWIHLRIDFAVKLLYANCSMFDNQAEENRKVNNVRTRKGVTPKSQGITFLLKDLKKLYSGEILTDVVLKSANGFNVKAHKVILAARSPYFNRLIQWNPSAFLKPAVPVPVDNVNAKSLFVIVHWMYTGNLLEDIDVENLLQETIKAAMKFEMSDLLKILEKRKHSFAAGGQCSNCDGHGDRNEGASQLRVQPSKSVIRKMKRAILAWFPLLRYRFGQRPVGLLASVISAFFGIYELI